MMERFANARGVTSLYLIVIGLAGACYGDTYTVTLGSDASATPVSGRLILFFVTESHPSWRRVSPVDGPFFESPQPIVAIDVEDLAPGASVIIDGLTPAFPASIDSLSGPVRVQAVLDIDRSERSFLDGPGNILSETIELVVSARSEETARLDLTKVIRRPLRADRDNLRWIEVRSRLLSEFHGRDVFHRAGVALPVDYANPDSSRSTWPTIYLIPDFGRRHEAAAEYAAMLRVPGVRDIAPQAVYIVLDPESPLGHHGFLDSPNNGPCGTAFVEEFVPYLEGQLRLAAVPEARLLSGMSSGAWASLWLQLHHPDVFGGCWAAAPDPVDFSAFQMSDLYRDDNLFVGPDGAATPSYREQIGLEAEAVRMTVRQESHMELVIDSHGRSGQQWDSWEAMFSLRDASRGLPVPMFDPHTGAIDRSVVEHWRRFDIARLVDGDWQRFGPILTQRVRLACGELDSYYLNRAVERFRQMVESHAPNDGAGYIDLIEHATHNNLQTFIFQRWNREMREHFQAHGLHE